MTIIGKSKAALALILDAFSSQGNSSEIVYIFNNLNIHFDVSYPGLIIIETGTPQGNKCVLGAVMPETKETIFKAFPKCNYRTLINSKAFVSNNSQVSAGSLIDANASISSGVKIGNFVTVYSGSSIQHDSTLGDFVTVCPNVSICGDVKIGNSTFIGAGTTIKNGIKIGAGVTIGCGSVVIGDVPDFKTVYGLVK